MFRIVALVAAVALVASPASACPVAQAAIGCQVAVAQPQFAVAAPVAVMQQFAVQAYAAPQFVPQFVQPQFVQPQFSVAGYGFAAAPVIVQQRAARGRSVVRQRSVVRVR